MYVCIMYVCLAQYYVDVYNYICVCVCRPTHVQVCNRPYIIKYMSVHRPSCR